MRRRGEQRLVGVLCATVLALGAPLPGAAQSPERSGRTLPEVLESIARARVVTRILYVTAHPDDECASVMPYLARGLGADVALLSLTRGEGGQNALGPEYGPRLGVLRTQELLAATRLYGVRLYFGRAPDFGYSKTAEETLRMWGETPLEDLVRVIRTFRPHIVINNWGGVRTGHGHHQAAGLLTPKGFDAAADASQFPQQLAEGLKTWRAKFLLQAARGETAGALRVPGEQISPLWGKSYNEIGAEGCAQHRTQGVGGFRNSPFFRNPRYVSVVAGTDFQAARFAEGVASLGENIFALKPALPELKNIEESVVSAETAARRLEWAAAVKALAAAGRTLAGIVEKYSAAKYVEGQDVVWELEQVRGRINTALESASALVVSAQANRGEIVAGETFSVRVAWQRRADVAMEIGQPVLQLPPGWTARAEESDAASARFTVSVSTGAKSESAAFGGNEPWPHGVAQALLRVRAEDYVFELLAPVEAVRSSTARADLLPVAVVPTATITLEPRRLLVVEARTKKPYELIARVHYYGTQPAEFTAGLEMPAGWQATSAAALKFAGAGDQIARFLVTPPAQAAAGRTVLKAYARQGREEFRTSLEPLPTLPTRMWSEPAEVQVSVFRAAVPQGLRVGYVAAENDLVPGALREIGVNVEMLDEVALAFGDLSRFDAIAVGIRAYELRGDLPRANQRLLDYAAAGGTLVVQYQRDGEWNRLKPAPYPASIDDRTARISDETSPVRMVVPQDPLLNFPNQITPQDFDGWVQERGLYFWTKYDARYKPLLAMRDPGEEETLGGLVYARHGKGVYIYTGLSFFRQLPDGVPGAFRLFVNLLSQSKAGGQRGGAGK